MTVLSDDELLCDVLLFFATQTEKEQLQAVAAEMGLPFVEKSDLRVGTYYWMGRVGNNRVNAVKTRMGPFGHQGSAYQAILYKTHSAATGLVQLGMAFGIDRSVQKHGDVLVSRFIFPYDYRKIQEGADGYIVDYSETKRHPAKASLLQLFDRERGNGSHPLQVHAGGLLSGGARIFSQQFLRELVSSIEAAGFSEFVGGEMEGVGLLSVSERARPVWIVVKGISDFADDARHAEIEGTRLTACRNAATFVLSALRRATP